MSQPIKITSQNTITWEFLTNELKKTFQDSFKFKDSDMLILYGSAAHGNIKSDFDCCLIQDGNLTNENIKKAKEIVINFHKKYGLRLDNEVPYENKLIYTSSEVQTVITKTPFRKTPSDEIIIDKIQKSEEFLSSPQIKERLLFNVLTTDSLLLLGDRTKFQEYQNKAWETLTLLSFSFYNNKLSTPEEFVENICISQKNNAQGEDFLGYKKERSVVLNYLNKQTALYFMHAIQSGKMITDGNNKFKINPIYLQQFINNIPLYSETKKISANSLDPIRNLITAKMRIHSLTPQKM